MTIQELMNKHKYITDINNFNGVINVTVLLDIKYQTNSGLLEFKCDTIEECDKFLDDNYLKIKYEVMEEILLKQNKKIYNQRKELRNLIKKNKKKEKINE